MAFLGQNDILVFEKIRGTVQRIVNGNMLAQPILSANVATEGERDMWGLLLQNIQQQMEIHLYFFIILKVTVTTSRKPCL